MKKILFSLTLVGSLGLNLYLLNSDVIVKNDLDSDSLELEVNDEIKLAQSAVEKKKDHKEKHIENLKNIKQDFLPENNSSTDSSAKYKDEKSPETYEEEYQKSRENWKKDLTEYMEVDLGLLPEHVEKYQEISLKRESAISTYMKPRFEDNIDEPYYFTVEDNVAVGKINERYLNLLKSELGHDAYGEYIKFRKKYNKKSLENGQSNFFVEF